MFRHFVGNIYILEEPPSPADTQLELTFPDELLADVDEEQYKKELTKEQMAKLLQYKEDMAQILGQESFDRLRSEGVRSFALVTVLASSARFTRPMVSEPLRSLSTICDSFPNSPPYFSCIFSSPLERSNTSRAMNS